MNAAAGAETVSRLIRAARDDGRSMLDEAESLEVLRACEIPTVAFTAIPATADDAQVIRQAHEIGFPIVLKGLIASVAHKTERGLVFTSITDETGLVSSLARLRARAECELGTLLLQEHVDRARELAAGMINDAVFGPTVMVGLGGINAEAVDDVVFRTAPLTVEEARGALDRLRTSRILDAYRGHQHANRKALAAILVALGDLGLSNPEISELDVNPVMIRHDGSPVAADAVVILATTT